MYTPRVKWANPNRLLRRETACRPITSQPLERDRQNRHRSSSTLGPSGIQTPLYYDSVDRQSLKRLKDRLDVEVYRLNGPDFEHEIEMAFLNNLETPLKLAFVGGEEAKQFDGQYSGVLIPDGPNVEEDLCRFCRSRSSG